MSVILRMALKSLIPAHIHTPDDALVCIEALKSYAELGAKVDGDSKYRQSDWASVWRALASAVEGIKREQS